MPLEERRLYEFGPFRLDPAERLLLRGEDRVALTPKAYETLLALVENAGRALQKEELLRRIWPDTFVEEVSLARNISVLRKVLGDQDGTYIETLPKRGYRFVAPIRQSLLPGECLVIDERTVAQVTIEKTETGPWHAPLVRLMAALVLAVLLAAAGAYLLGRRGLLPAVKSLAVLPLKSLPGAVEERHLELGIADNIIGKVSQIPGLTVRPTGAVRHYLESRADPLQAARELKVDAILDGTLQVEGGRIRVNMNLLQTSSGASLWTQAFDAPLSDIFAIEDQIAMQAAQQLRVHLDSARQSRMTRRSTGNPAAYEYYLKGLYSNEATRGSGRTHIDAAIVLFRKATDLDPSFAQAWAQLATCYGELLNFYGPAQEISDAARDAASHAYALDPDLPELLIFRAQTFWSWRGRYQMEDAIRELRRGAGYNNADVRSMLGVLYAHAGLERQAIAELRRAMEIDPTNSLHPDRLAQAWVCLGQYPEARAAFERAFAMESEHKGDLAASAIPFVYARDFQQARQRLEKARTRNPRQVMTQANLALLAALEGKFSEAEAAIPSGTEEVEKFHDGHHASFAYAQICALQGKSAEAVRWLRAAAEAGMPNYPMFGRDPFLSRIRNSAEFIQFMTDLKARWDAMVREFQ